MNFSFSLGRCCFALAVGFLLCVPGPLVRAADTYVRFHTNLGNIDVELFNDDAPNTVANFNSYNYTNSIIHRVATIANSGLEVVQGGGYTLSGSSVIPITPHSGVVLNSEYSPLHPNVRGTLAMALTSAGPNSATTDWFFNSEDNSDLLDTSAISGPFTVFGQVMNSSSLSVVDVIQALPLADLGGDFTEIPAIGGTEGQQSIQVSQLVVVSSITPLTVQTLSEWQTAKLTPSEQGDSNFTSTTGTPFNDSVPNLFKYVFDIDPSVPMSATSRLRLPVLGTATISGTPCVTLTFHEHDALIGVTVSVETSPDLVTWTTLSNPTIVQTGTDSLGDPIEQVRVVRGTGPQFIRLNVTQP